MEKKKIVVVDDEKNLCSLIKEILEATEKYEVFVAHDGADGEKLCIQTKPALIFLDYVMPGERGDEVIRHLKGIEDMKETPIILMSGLGEMIFFEKKEQWKWILQRLDDKQGEGVLSDFKWEEVPSEMSERMGFSIYLPKPFLPGTLLEVVNFVLAKKVQKNFFN